MKLIVVCSRPGLIRGGVRNPAVAEYPVGTFSDAQLRELVNEPAITVAYGVRLTPDVTFDGAVDQAREALAISVGLNLDGLGDAAERLHPTEPVIARPLMEQGTDLSLAGAMHAVADADAAKLPAPVEADAVHVAKGRRVR